MKRLSLFALFLFNWFSARAFADPLKLLSASPQFWATNVNASSQKSVSVTFDQRLRSTLTDWGFVPAAKGEPAMIGASPQWFGTTSSAMRSPTCGRSRSSSCSTSHWKRGETSWIDASRRRSRKVVILRPFGLGLRCSPVH